MRAEIITIGDELLIGQVVDTNSAWMAQRLNEAGVELYEIVSVHDDKRQIMEALDTAFRHADVVITTGGLGPTKDDITKQVLCEYFHTTLVPNVEVEAHVKELYKDRPQVLNRLTATQWLVPQNAEILPNRVGSAPLMYWPNNGHALFCLPGVPREMEVAMTEQVLPRLHSDTQIIHRTLTVSGIPESALAIELEEWETHLPQGMKLAYLPQPDKRQINLRLSSYGSCSAQEVDEEFAKLQFLVRAYRFIR